MNWGEGDGGRVSGVSEATYLAEFDSSHSRIIVDNRKVVFYLLLLPERDPIHKRGLNVVVIRLLVLRDPFIIRRPLFFKRAIVYWIIPGTFQSFTERAELVLEDRGILVLLISVTVDTGFWRAGSRGKGRSGQPLHSISVPLLGFFEVRTVDSVIDPDGVTCVVLGKSVRSRELTGN